MPNIRLGYDIKVISLKEKWIKSLNLITKQLNANKQNLNIYIKKSNEKNPESNQINSLTMWSLI
jgi:hypothetical protein